MESNSTLHCEVWCKCFHAARGRSTFHWTTAVLARCLSPSSVSFSVLGDAGTEISFLKRRLVMLQDGIMVVPGTTVEKVLKHYEQFFGTARMQKTPCDSGIQQQDLTQELGQVEASRYRSIIGLLVYICPEIELTSCSL